MTIASSASLSAMETVRKANGKPGLARSEQERLDFLFKTLDSASDALSLAPPARAERLHVIIDGTRREINAIINA